MCEADTHQVCWLGWIGVPGKTTGVTQVSRLTWERLTYLGDEVQPSPGASCQPVQYIPVFSNMSSWLLRVENIMNFSTCLRWMGVDIKPIHNSIIELAVPWIDHGLLWVLSAVFWWVHVLPCPSVVSFIVITVGGFKWSTGFLRNTANFTSLTVNGSFTMSWHFIKHPLFLMTFEQQTQLIASLPCLELITPQTYVSGYSCIFNVCSNSRYMFDVAYRCTSDSPLQIKIILDDEPSNDVNHPTF